MLHIGGCNIYFIIWFGKAPRKNLSYNNFWKAIPYLIALIKSFSGFSSVSFERPAKSLDSIYHHYAMLRNDIQKYIK